MTIIAEDWLKFYRNIGRSHSVQHKKHWKWAKTVLYREKYQYSCFLSVHSFGETFLCLHAKPKHTIPPLCCLPISMHACFPWVDLYHNTDNWRLKLALLCTSGELCNYRYSHFHGPTQDCYCIVICEVIVVVLQTHTIHIMDEETSTPFQKVVLYNHSPSMRSLSTFNKVHIVKPKEHHLIYSNMNMWFHISEGILHDYLLTKHPLRWQSWKIFMFGSLMVLKIIGVTFEYWEIQRVLFWRSVHIIFRQTAKATGFLIDLPKLDLHTKYSIESTFKLYLGLSS